MTITDQMNAFKAVGDAFVKTKGGKCMIAGDKSQALDLLAAAPGAVRIVLLFVDETPRGEETAAQMSRVDRSFMAVLSRGIGLNLEEGNSLVKGTGGGEPLFALWEQFRDRIRATLLDPNTCERPLYYKGGGMLNLEGFPRTDALVINFAVGTDIGQISDSPEEDND